METSFVGFAILEGYEEKEKSLRESERNELCRQW